jgi:cell shape-determining protein MreC
MRNSVVLALLVALMLINKDLGFAQTNKELTELRREIEALKTGQLAIQKDLAEIKNLILQREFQSIKELFQAKQGSAAAPIQAPAPPAEPKLLWLVSLAARSKEIKTPR